jgi:endonuclease/exonuclease/phosphatase family metal-dependent hydrolase
MTTQLKLLTYNIHYGIGRDGRYQLGRIERILREEQPHIVALQEVDNGLPRTKYDNQSRILADSLGMDFFHCVTRRIDGGDFGITVLSAFPILRNHRHDITHPTSREPRYCLRVDVEVAPERIVHVFNCHLGLGTRERHYQRRQMLSEAMLLSEDLHHPVILMGDFNDRPVPVVHDDLRAHFKDAFVSTGKRHGPTFWWGPIHLRLDHIYISPEIRVVESWVRNDSLTRVASDHRPLLALVEVEWQPVRADNPAREMAGEERA